MTDVLIVTGTLGDSCNHMSRVLTELRQFTKIPFKRLVSDDGTADSRIRNQQRSVCEAHGAEWIEQPGPVWGISYNLNFMFEEAEKRGYEWVFLIEDACRPGIGWLETALDALERVGKREWCGHKVGAIGMTSSFENWHMVIAKALPCELTVNDFFDKKNQTIYDIFWGSPHYRNWNDGLWCWQRMHPEFLKSCQSHEADNWPEIIRQTVRDPVLRHEWGVMKWEEKQGKWGYQSMSGWPRTRGVSWVMGPSAWGLYNLKAWREVGRFRDGCTFYEGHLGMRLNKAGYLCLNAECPPWIHQSGLAFAQRHGQREPRHHHEPLDGPNGLLAQDFGCPGEKDGVAGHHGDMGKLAESYFKPGELTEINKELSTISLHYDPAWEAWL